MLDSNLISYQAALDENLQSSEVGAGREPYSLEAEHGLLGAMLQRPELIDTLSDDLMPAAFYFHENAEVYRAIVALRAATNS